MSHSKSLRWQLVLRVAAVLACLMVVVNIGFFIFILLWQPYAKQTDRAVVPEIAKAIKNAESEPEIDGAVARNLGQAFPELWFVAVTSQGKAVRFGNVPVEFESIAPRLPRMKVLDARDAEDPRYTVELTEVIAHGVKLHLLYGGRVPDEPRFMTLIKGLWIIYVPFTLAPVVVVFLAIPVIVGRSLTGVAKTTARAAGIDARSLGVRLPKDDVVEELHPLVDAVNAALTRIDEDVSRRQRFLANAAHELRTPIAILQTRIETQAAGAVRDRLLLDIKRLAAMAEQLLDIQRFSAIQDWNDVDLVALCETVAADIAPLALTAGYEIVFDAEIESFVVKGDVASLERAVTNLAINAVEHGGGQGRIMIEVLRDGTIEVSDEGPGIPADQREKVFEPFYRVLPKSTGAGLGLSLVHQIAHSHNGHVSIVEQMPGARFKLVVGRRA